MGYSLHVIWGFRQHPGTVLSDWLWYAIFPLAAYGALAAAAVTGLYDNAEGLYLFAALLTALLVAGIRNAWDMLVWLVTSSRDST